MVSDIVILIVFMYFLVILKGGIFFFNFKMYVCMIEILVWIFLFFFLLLKIDKVDLCICNYIK